MPIAGTSHREQATPLHQTEGWKMSRRASRAGSFMLNVNHSVSWRRLISTFVAQHKARSQSTQRSRVSQRLQRIAGSPATYQLFTGDCRLYGVGGWVRKFQHDALLRRFSRSDSLEPTDAALRNLHAYMHAYNYRHTAIIN